ncbi:hypothetical protein [Hymenobacter pini]|uniref:hypothetical protein n=1 Tax=Hymenobacter pini TaxID=2880879 RepID=UPI001CF5902B|nr:hypothetical protein [Hymenobacter pini]MCA8829912.1 hypothetical protein [Hymenobacter pini]
MKDLLRRVQLITPLVFDFPISKDEFLQRLKPHVAPPHINPFGRLGRIFSPTIAPYSGTIQPNFIRIKPRTDGNQAFLPTIEANLLQTESGVRLEGELNGASFFVLAPACFYLFFVLFALISLISRSKGLVNLSILLLIMSVQGIFFVGIPYFRARRSMQEVAYNLERDLYYFVERPAPAPAS